MHRTSLLFLFFFLASASLAQGGEPSILGDAVVDFPASGTPSQQVRGYLSKPAGKGPFPAVVLLHGCSGPGKYLGFWKQYFLKIGFACLVVDSFGPRGVKEICSGSDRVSESMRIADTYGALDHLAKRSDVLPKQVLAVGFSNGAGIALDVVSSKGLAQRPKSFSRFRAAVGFYPNCDHPGRAGATFLSPVLILSGADDDLTPAGYCRDLAENHKTGQPVLFTAYPGAMHGFASPTTPRTTMPDFRNRYSPTGKGATLAGDPKATADAQVQIESFVRRFVLPPVK